ncbi:MAG: trypsin-like peptidase domain-containing protein [Candidatus Kerfeldbacteria bacterium]|nr:trypsin-like peptidase domain-containing protein [Candidatus Kerfeldbacteria bacterium]
MDQSSINPAIPKQDPQETINTSISGADQPRVYKAVRAVGVVKPTYLPGNKNFGNSLQVIGTAFWLKDYKVLVTCAHVIQGLLAGPLEQTGLLVVGNLGNYARAVIASVDLAHDLAVLKIVDKNEIFINSEAAQGLEMVNEYPSVGKAVGYAGFPMGSQLLNSIHSPTYAEGVVAVQLRENPSRKEIQITGAVAGGYSGAPVVLKDESVKLIGVLASGPSAPGTQGNIFMAISWQHVEALAKLANS